jgi:hypothetical protein
VVGIPFLARLPISTTPGDAGARAAVHLDSILNESKFRCAFRDASGLDQPLATARNTPVVQAPAFRLPRKVCRRCGGIHAADTRFCSCGYDLAADPFPIWEGDPARPPWEQQAFSHQVGSAPLGCAPTLFIWLTCAIVGGVVGAIIGDSEERSSLLSGLLTRMFALAGAALGVLVGAIVTTRLNSARR